MFNVAPYLLLIRLVVWACCCGPRVQTVRWMLVSNSRARVVTYMSHVEAFVTAGSKLNQAVKAKFWEPIKGSNRKNKRIKTCGYSLTFDLLKIKWSRATIILILVMHKCFNRLDHPLIFICPSAYERHCRATARFKRLSSGKAFTVTISLVSDNDTALLNQTLVNQTIICMYIFFVCWFTGDDPANEETPHST